MQLVSAVFLGLIQGLTEFLPISSSGHLVLGQELLGYRSSGLVLETVVHVATSLAIIIYFRQRFVSVLSGAVGDPATRRLILMLGLAFAATALLGLVLRDRIITAFDSPGIVGGMLLGTAAALISIRYIKPAGDPASIFTITWKVALIVGLAQGLAIFPGLSRSGLTIVAGLWGGMGRTAAAEFSFLLAVPTILAASLFSLWQEPDISTIDPGGLLLAGVAAFISGLIAIHWLMRWLQRGHLWWFSIYCTFIGGAALLGWGLGVL